MVIGHIYGLYELQCHLSFLCLKINTLPPQLHKIHWPDTQETSGRTVLGHFKDEIERVSKQ